MSVFACHLCALLWLQDIIIIFWYVMQRTFCCNCCCCSCCYCCCCTVHVGVARYLNVFKLDMLRPMWAQIGQEGDMLNGCKWLMRELELNGGITIIFITIITIVFITIIITLIITITNLNKLCLGQAMTCVTNFFCIFNDLGNKLEWR